MAASLHGLPLRAVAQIQETVILEESGEARCRKIQHGSRRTGPDGGGHRQQVVIAEALPQVLAL